MDITLPFRDRTEAGQVLAPLLAPYVDQHAIVLGLPRGGVVVAAEVARALHAPLDVLVVRKVGAPGHGEVAVGAVGEGGVVIVNQPLLARLGIPPEEFDWLAQREQAEVQARALRLRGGRPLRSLQGRTVVLVDDGLATGATARAAADVARHLGARRLVLAVPVAARSTLHADRLGVDQIVCVAAPSNFVAVGQWYQDFRQVTDQEVLDALEHMPEGIRGPAEIAVSIPAGPVTLAGDLVEPVGASGIVIFAHGSGSSRHSPRNQAVARALNRAGLGTLLFDLLTDQEAGDRRNVFDIPLLAERLEAATRVVADRAGNLPIGYFGASTGAGAALWAAADLGGRIAAVVSRGGRPDLALARLGRVTAPTLFIVGGSDVPVIELTEAARRHLGAPSDLRIVPGASHLFEEPGALDQVAGLAANWFSHHFAADGRRVVA
jgi:putative phosphoribosyl transferase